MTNLKSGKCKINKNTIAFLISRSTVLINPSSSHFSLTKKPLKKPLELNLNSSNTQNNLKFEYNKKRKKIEVSLGNIKTNIKTISINLKENKISFVTKDENKYILKLEPGQQKPKQKKVVVKSKKTLEKQQTTTISQKMTEIAKSLNKQIGNASNTASKSDDIAATMATSGNAFNELDDSIKGDPQMKERINLAFEFVKQAGFNPQKLTEDDYKTAEIQILSHKVYIFKDANENKIELDITINSQNKTATLSISKTNSTTTNVIERKIYELKDGTLIQNQSDNHV